MMVFTFFLQSLFLFAVEPPIHWQHIVEVKNRHEFYRDNEPIIKPRDSWQNLFSLIYYDSSVTKVKDCLFYKVPGDNEGILKIKTILLHEDCEKHLLLPGDRHYRGIKLVQYAILEKEIQINLSDDSYKNHRWRILLKKSSQKTAPEMHLSSGEYKNSRIIFLANKKFSFSKENINVLKDGILCHDINDDCLEIAPSRCSDCPNSWYEVPNGCLQGPKYCGTIGCGEKNAPACRRGMKWQRRDGEFDCRTDSSFAYCAKGNIIHCEGKKAFCR